MSRYSALESVTLSSWHPAPMDGIGRDCGIERSNPS